MYLPNPYLLLFFFKQKTAYEISACLVGSGISRSYASCARVPAAQRMAAVSSIVRFMRVFLI